SSTGRSTIREYTRTPPRPTTRLPTRSSSSTTGIVRVSPVAVCPLVLPLLSEAVPSVEPVPVIDPAPALVVPTPVLPAAPLPTAPAPLAEAPVRLAPALPVPVVEVP